MIPEDIGVEQILKGGNNPNSDTSPITSRLDVAAPLAGP